MNKDRYCMSFTTGGLFRQESAELAAMYLALGDWGAVRNEVISKNILQSRTLSTLKRISSEVIFRLKTLGAEELNFLVNACRQDQGYLLWIAMCRRYKFIADFAIEILCERYVTLKTDLRHEDFDSFFNNRSEWHPELDKIRPATKNKLRQVLFKMLREADLLTANNIINAAMPSQAFIGLFSQVNLQDILYVPAFESDLKRMAQ
jgi:hypothetical protein